MSGYGRKHRDTIFIEDASVISQQEYDGQQYIIRLHAPQCAGTARPGTFVHVCCDPAVPMRRPLSIMRASREDGWLELFYKVIGHGLQHLSSRRKGDSISIMGPIGRPFVAGAQCSRPLLIGGGVGIPPMIFLAETLIDGSGEAMKPVVLMGSELPFPFAAVKSTLPVPGLGRESSHAMPLLESMGIPSRLASGSGYEGCYEGFVTELARQWLDSLSLEELGRVEIFACGPVQMLKACADLARSFNLPCQISLEEFMACAVGGCAGCTVEIHDEERITMQRVCVDGPVFDSRAVYPQ